MLALADEDGMVMAALTGIAHESRLDKETTAKALEILASPDPDSRTPDNEGRRIEAVPGGYVILNYKTYRNLQNTAERRKATRERVARHRQKSPVTQCNASNKCNDNDPNVTHTDTDADTKADADTNASKEKSIPLPVAPTAVPEYSGYHADTLGFVKWWQEEKHAVVSAKWIGHVETVFAGSKVPLDFAEKAAKDFEGTKKPWLIAEELIKAWREETQYDEAW